jgi:hypothetical protein
VGKKREFMCQQCHRDDEWIEKERESRKEKEKEKEKRERERESELSC